MKNTMTKIFSAVSLARFKYHCTLALLPLLSVVLVTSCRLVQNTAELPGKTVGMVTKAGKGSATSVDPVQVQQTLLRFADGYSTRMVVGIEKLQQGTNAFETAEMLKWKIALASETCTIATGPNAIANLLDITIFVTVTRMALEEYWQPKVFGNSAQPMLDSCRNSETEIWRVTATVLSPQQLAELHKAIEEWHRQNPQPESVLAARALNFSSCVAGANQEDAAKPGSVFGLLGVDPLAGMDPAVREIAQTRIFAERALYVTQKMPMLLRWQTELLSRNAIGNLFDNLATERTNLVATLAGDEMNLRPTLVELRQTVESATELLKSSDVTVKSLDTFLARFDKGTNAPVATTTTNTRPFDILDYAATAREVTATIKEFNTAINSLDNAMPQLKKVGDAFGSTGNRLLIHLLVIGALLIFLALIAALTYRRVVGKWAVLRSQTKATCDISTSSSINKTEC